MEKIEILDKVLDFIYPPVCAFCGKINSNYLCDECKNRLEKIENAHINKYRSKAYDEHIYLFNYKDIRNSILEYKFNDKGYYYKSFVNILLNNKKICQILKCYDIITPVPIHNKRKMERGYNQTGLISKDLSKNIESIKYVEILKKVVNTVPQSTLNKKERIENSKNIYQIKNNFKEEINNKRILIFDDIYTTGTTINECAKVIKKLKPMGIGALTIAKD